MRSFSKVLGCFLYPNFPNSFNFTRYIWTFKSTKSFSKYNFKKTLTPLWFILWASFFDNDPHLLPFMMKRAAVLKCAFLKNDVVYECTSCELNIFRHQNKLGYLLHPHNFDDWKCSIDRICIRNKIILKKTTL